MRARRPAGSAQRDQCALPGTDQAPVDRQRRQRGPGQPASPVGGCLATAAQGAQAGRAKTAVMAGLLGCWAPNGGLFGNAVFVGDPGSGGAGGLLLGLNGMNGLTWPEGRAVELLYAASTDLGDFPTLGVRNNSLSTLGDSI
jgi:hypothetical protein